MSTDNGKMFRSALSGYNKDDVNRYILDMDRKNKEKSDAMTKELDDMGKANAALSEDKARLEEKITETTARLTEQEGEIARLKEEINRMTEKVGDMTEQLRLSEEQAEAKSGELTKVKAENAELSSKYAALIEESRDKDAQIKANAEKYAADLETMRAAYENELKKVSEATKVDEGVAYKLDMYDKISSQIGDILINANRNSDEIITSAKNEAEKLLNEANAKANEFSQKMHAGIHRSSVQTLNELKDEFDANVENCVKEIQTCITEIQYEANALMSFLSKKQAEMNERIDFCHSNISDTIAGKLDGLTEQCSSIIHDGCAEK